MLCCIHAYVCLSNAQVSHTLLINAWIFSLCKWFKSKVIIFTIFATTLSNEEVSSKVKLHYKKYLGWSDHERLMNVINHSVPIITPTDCHNYYINTNYPLLRQANHYKWTYICVYKYLVLILCHIYYYTHAYYYIHNFMSYILLHTCDEIFISK